MANPAPLFVRPLLRCFIPLLFALVIIGRLAAQTSFTVMWDANPESDIAGYTVHLGTSSTTYSRTIDIPTGTTADLTGLDYASTYYCAVQAYNTAGFTSVLSEEISFTTLASPNSDIAVESNSGENYLNGSDTVYLGSTDTGTSSPEQILHLINRGNNTLSGIAVSITGTSQAAFHTTQPATTTLAPGASATIRVTFSPGSTGVLGATLAIASNDPDENPFLIDLSGIGTEPAAPGQPEIAVESHDGSPLSDGSGNVSFGWREIHSAAVQRTFTIRNTGSADLSGLAVTLSGTHAADFTSTSPDTTTLAPGASTTFSVAFSPSAAGTRNASLSIASNDADESPFETALLGVGLALPEITVKTAGGSLLVNGSSKLNLGVREISHPATAQTLTIRNTGTGTLSGLAVTLAGSQAAEFSATNPAANTLAPGASTTFSVSFTPATTGTRSATLRIASNDADENPFDITLTGIGFARPEIAVTRSSGANLTSASSAISFSSAHIGESGSNETLTIHNTGTGTLSGLALSMTGGNPGDFSTTPLTTTSIAPGQSTTFTLGFTPTAAGNRSATIRIASNDASENPFLVNLLGHGSAVPDIDVTRIDGSPLPPATPPLDAASIPLEPLDPPASFTIHNRGTADLEDLEFKLLGADPDHFTVSGSAPPRVAPGASSTFTVAFTPTTSGDKSALLCIASNDPDENPYEIPLAGHSRAIPKIEIALASAPPLVSGKSMTRFGQTAIGQRGITRTFTIRNTGNANLTGLSVNRAGAHRKDFLITSPAATLAPGASTTFRVTFRPKQAGARNATIRVSSNAPAQATFALPVNGAGKASPVIQISTTSSGPLIDEKAYVSFGSAGIMPTSRPKTFTITNRGTATLRKLAIVRTGSNKSDFIVTRLKAKSLAPGKSTKLRVTFRPRANGTRWAGLSILSNDRATRSFDIVLTGKGTAARTSIAQPTTRLISPTRLTSPSLLSPASPATQAQLRPLRSVVRIDGKRYRCITIPNPTGKRLDPDRVEVSSNLIDWFSGKRHTSVIKNNGILLQVRDNTPFDAGHKRHIRMRP